MKFWITKYALTGGIEIVDVEARIDGTGKTFFSINGNYFFLGKDAFDNEADAIADAEKRRTKKIASLHKQIAKLEKLTFSE